MKLDERYENVMVGVKLELTMAEASELMYLLGEYTSTRGADSLFCALWELDVQASKRDTYSNTIDL